jgi:hypothetical protein
MVAETDIVSRSISELTPLRELRLVRLHGTGLQQVGTDNSISTGPYDQCSLWSDALWDHPEQPDGIAYQSRHDSSEFCLALFDRRIPFSVTPSRPLPSIAKEIAAILNRYGKSISPAPR